VTAHSRRLLEFASEVAFSSQDIPAHSIPVTIESANTACVPANLNIPDEPQRTPAQTFAEYIIAQLPEWERGLIKGNRQVKSDYHQSLSQCLLTKTMMYVVHDGGLIKDTDHGSYGWVLASNAGIPREGWGKARGHPVQSFRTEGYGRMALACFIGHFIRFFSIPVHDTCILTNETRKRGHDTMKKSKCCRFGEMRRDAEVAVRTFERVPPDQWRLQRTEILGARPFPWSMGPQLEEAL
jgi:hypothetical protein